MLDSPTLMNLPPPPKSPPPPPTPRPQSPSPRSIRVQASAAQYPPVDARRGSLGAPSTEPSQLKRANSLRLVGVVGTSAYAFAEVEEEDLVERFLAGGGQVPTRPEAAAASAAAELASWMAHDKGAQAVAAAQSQLPVGQQYKMEAILQERAKLLSRFFEHQLKKHFEVMKREVARMAKQHHRDVASLDERFKAKMAGLGRRFKALEAEEAKMSLVRADNSALAQEVARLEGVRDEHERAAEAAARAMAAKEAEVAGLVGNLARAGEEAKELYRQLEFHREDMRKLEQAMEAKLDVVRAELRAKVEELGRAAEAHRTAQAAFDAELRTKNAEVHELEGSIATLTAFTSQMKGFVQTVQVQIAKRETDMRTQLALLKNTVAFSLYVDESMSIDVTDVATTELMVRPVVVLPSGCSYSAATVAQIEAEALASGTPPICPTSGEAITGVVPNVALESILARYLFKQQVTKDVLATLKEFVSKAGHDAEDQPLEAYMQRMKEVMVERLHMVHAEQLATAASGYEEKLGVSELMRGDAESRASEARGALELTLSEMRESRAQAVGENERLAATLEQMRVASEEATLEIDELRRAKERALMQHAEAEARIARMEADTKHDTDELEAEPATAILSRVRKAELIRLTAALSEEERRRKAVEEKARTHGGELAEVARRARELAEELSGERRRLQRLDEEHAALQAQSRDLAAANGVLEERASAAEDRAASAEASVFTAVAERDAKGAALAERELKLRQALDDGRKLRSRFEERDASARAGGVEVARLSARLDDLEGASARHARELGAARESAAREQASRGEAESVAALLGGELARHRAMVDEREADNASIRQKVAHAEAEIGRLGRLLDAHGIVAAGALTLESDMEAVKKDVGVYDSLARLPKVPVLEHVVSALAAAESETRGTAAKLQNLRRYPQGQTQAAGAQPEAL